MKLGCHMRGREFLGGIFPRGKFLGGKYMYITSHQRRRTRRLHYFYAAYRQVLDIKYVSWDIGLISICQGLHRVSGPRNAMYARQTSIQSQGKGKSICQIRRWHLLASRIRHEAHGILDGVKKWAESNNLKLNTDKSKEMLVPKSGRWTLDSSRTTTARNEEGFWAENPWSSVH